MTALQATWTLEQALAYGEGQGRTATPAHPLCRCGKPYQPTCRICLAKPNQPCRHQWGDALVLTAVGRAKAHQRAEERAGTAKECPMHKAEQKR